MDRRTVVAAAGALLATPSLFAQKTPQRRVVGFLSPVPYVAQRWEKGVIAVRLRYLGWVEGGNLVVEQARADGREERLAGRTR